MSFHTAQTFTFGETPSATKWNYIWENDYALQDWSAFTNATFPIALIDDEDITTEKLEFDARGRVLIDTVTLGSAGANIDFSAIPQTYRHLEVRVNALLASGGDAGGNLYFNGDTTTTNYNMQILDLNGATVSGSTSNSAASLIHSGSSNNVNIIQIPHYTETFNKAAIIESLRIGTSTLRPNRRYQRWNSTGAITSIRLNASPNYASGATAYLYGMW
mgnify:CR=1 FL=1